ncbi:endonuclease domain-containing protein [Gammaproteobacteria bacterium]|nr:endonuclease domain-containing protein [Gammaproteobacteria bacterium]
MSPTKLTTEDFIRRAKEAHGFKYDYSKVKYIGANKDIKIICPEHGPFWQRASNHMTGRGCDDCGDIDRLKYKTKSHRDVLSDFERVHKGKYSYEKVNYINSKTNITINCPIHDDFSQLPTHHLQGSGCPKCRDEQTSIRHSKTQDDFIQQAIKIHGDKYDYSKTIVSGSHNYLIVTCPKHKDWEVLQTNHLSGYGCPKCLHKAEGRICEYILKKNILIREFRIESKRYDFFLPDFNLIIERDGEQHYKDVQIKGAAIKVKAQQANDRLKTKMAKEAGFKIARIPYWLSKNEEEIEIENILAGKPTYPDVPDLKQEKTRPKPKRQN